MILIGSVASGIQIVYSLSGTVLKKPLEQESHPQDLKTFGALAFMTSQLISACSFVPSIPGIITTGEHCPELKSFSCSFLLKVDGS